MIDNDTQKIISKYRNNQDFNFAIRNDVSLFVTPDLPTNMVNAAINSYAKNISIDDVIIYFERTIFGYPHEGLIITNDCIYCKDGDTVKLCPLDSILNLLMVKTEMFVLIKTDLTYNNSQNYLDWQRLYVCLGLNDNTPKFIQSLALDILSCKYNIDVFQSQLSSFFHINGHIMKNTNKLQELDRHPKFYSLHMLFKILVGIVAKTPGEQLLSYLPLFVEAEKQNLYVIPEEIRKKYL
jgi:hypothetical protein